MKQISIILSLLLLSTVFAEYTLPDLGVTKTDPTCADAQTLLTTAQDDQTRLNKIVNTDIPNNIELLNTVKGLSKKACDLTDQIHALPSLLQTNEGSSAKNLFVIRLKDMRRHVEEKADDPIDQLFGEKVGHMVQIMTQITDPSFDKTKIDETCNELEDAIEDLSKYLAWAKDEINSQYLNEYLPNRITTLSSYFSNNCRSIVEAGEYIGVPANIGSPATTKSRTDTNTITFSKAFVNKPKVAVSLVGFDTSSQVSSILIAVTGVTTTSFTFQVVVSANSYVNSYKLRWIAVDGNELSMKVYTNYIEYKTDADLNGNWNKAGERTYARTNTLTAPLTGGTAITILTGFSFYATQGANSISVNTNSFDGTTLVSQAKVTGDTQLFGASWNTIVFTPGPAFANKTPTLIYGSNSASSGLTCANKVLPLPYLTSITFAKKTTPFLKSTITDGSNLDWTLATQSAGTPPTGGAFFICNPLK